MANKRPGSASADEYGYPEEELAEIFRNHSKKVYRYLLSLTHDPALSDDLLQETFLKAVLRISSYRQEASLDTWLCSIARNCYTDWMRKSARQKETALQDWLPGRKEDERDLELLSKIHRLREPYREILYLRLFGSLSFREIGEILEHSETWARVMFYRGKEEIRKELEQQ